MPREQNDLAKINNKQEQESEGDEKFGRTVCPERQAKTQSRYNKPPGAVKAAVKSRQPEKIQS